MEGKAAAKAELRKRMQLSSADVPVVGCVTRLTHQKGEGSMGSGCLSHCACS